MIGYVAMAITAAIIVAICVRIDNWQRDLTTNFAETDFAAEDAGLHPLTLDRPRDEIADLLTDWAASQANWQKVASEKGPDRTKMHFTRTTRFLRFIDDVHVTITANSLPDGEGCTINATSQSRIGKGDLGQNPRNLKALLSVCTQAHEGIR